MTHPSPDPSAKVPAPVDWETEKANARLAAIVESSDDAIISKTVHGTIQTWNPGAERLFGYTAREAIGAPITLIVPPERREEEEEDILSRIRRGGRVDHYETVPIAKDGRRLEISVSLSPIIGENGQIVGATAVARDITARKRDETALRLIQEMSVRLATALDPKVILEHALRTAMAIQETDLGLLSLVDREDGCLRPTASAGLDAEFLARVERAAGVRLSGRRAAGDLRDPGAGRDDPAGPDLRGAVPHPRHGRADRGGRDADPHQVDPGRRHSGPGGDGAVRGFAGEAGGLEQSEGRPGPGQRPGARPRRADAGSAG